MRDETNSLLPEKDSAIQHTRVFVSHGETIEKSQRNKRINRHRLRERIRGERMIELEEGERERERERGGGNS